MTDALRKRLRALDLRIWGCLDCGAQMQWRDAFHRGIDQPKCGECYSPRIYDLGQEPAAGAETRPTARSWLRESDSRFPLIAKEQGHDR